MQQIVDWLKNLGMSEYAEHFAENHIDLSVLPDLTDQGLEKLGVLLGDRRGEKTRPGCRRPAPGSHAASYGALTNLPRILGRTSIGRNQGAIPLGRQAGTSA
jgi:hypothetical protein